MSGKEDVQSKQTIQTEKPHSGKGEKPSATSITALESGWVSQD